MTYILVTLICAAVAYLAWIMIDYLAVEQDLLPAIERRRGQAEKLSMEVEWESDQKSKLHEKVQQIQRSVDDLQARVNLARKELQTEQTLLRRVELEVNRKELKARRKVVAG